jgi:trk system potassium uptake protein TrkH
MRLRPGLVIILGFLIFILAGAVLLALPISSADGTATNFLDACFTANSAACVTGLVTLDTGSHFSLAGLIVILIMIQLGGLGYMTLSTFIVLVFRQKLFIPEKLSFEETLNLYSPHDVLLVMRRMLNLVVIVEAAGALVLFLRWLPELGPGTALLYGIFHSISAFNNAGFVLVPHFASLRPYAADWTINLTITTLSLIGGLGFLLIADVLKGKRLTLHSRVTLLATAILVTLGALCFFALERHNPGTIGTLPLPSKILASYVQAVTPRTAGFSTVDTSKLFPATALFTMLLMFIGAGAGGTGGGLKVSTLAVIGATVWATLRGFRNTIIYNRRVPVEIVRRAVVITFLALAAVAVAFFVLSEVEKAPVMALAFETFSAFSNVGLTWGLTPLLSSTGKITLIVVMFVGRVGALILLLALMMDQKEPRLEPPKEGISIG